MRRMLTWLLFVTLTVRNCPKIFVHVLITEKNTAEPVRTILTCWDERVTTVLKQQSLLKTGIIEELWQSALFVEIALN